MCGIEVASYVCLVVAVLLLPCSTNMCGKDCRKQVASMHSRSAKKSDGGYWLLYINMFPSMGGSGQCGGRIGCGMCVRRSMRYMLR